jgi:hypothetical protein
MDAAFLDGVEGIAGLLPMVLLLLLPPLLLLLLALIPLLLPPLPLHKPLECLYNKTTRVC